MKALFQNKLVLIIAVIGVVLIAWYFLAGSSSPSPTLVATDVAGQATGTSTADAQLVATLLQLRTVTLDNSIFSSPVFQSLQDFSTPIVPEPAGRPDPFAPLSQNVAPSATTTKSAQIFTPKH